MYRYPESIENLIRELNKLPGVGQKTSERFLFHLLRQPKEELDRLGESIERLKESIVICSACQNYADTDPCVICADVNRDRSLLCVVAESPDVYAIERTGAYRGRYHVLGGVLNTLTETNPDRLTVSKLVERAKTESIKEILIATNPDMAGDTTALYVERALREVPVTITRLGRGLPLGGDIGYADEITLTSAIAGRTVEKKQNLS